MLKFLIGLSKNKITFWYRSKEQNMHKLLCLGYESNCFGMLATWTGINLYVPTHSHLSNVQLILLTYSHLSNVQLILLTYSHLSNLQLILLTYSHLSSLQLILFTCSHLSNLQLILLTCVELLVNATLDYVQLRSVQTVYPSQHHCYTC